MLLLMLDGVTNRILIGSTAMNDSSIGEILQGQALLMLLLMLDGVTNRILIGSTAMNDSSIGEFSLGVGHELVHIRDQGLSRAQTEYNAHGWAVSNVNSFVSGTRATQLEVWNMQMQSFWRGAK